MSDNCIHTFIQVGYEAETLKCAKCTRYYPTFEALSIHERQTSQLLAENKKLREGKSLFMTKMKSHVDKAWNESYDHLIPKEKS